MKRNWFPHHGQIGLVPRATNSYLHSLWVGLTAPLFNLPVMIWQEIVWPVIVGVGVILSFIFVTVLAGVCGSAVGVAGSDE